ncbi:hypothetical protein MBEBAB_0880 [Brevundimonas abyssalis TAR-001]|uniref:Uncharacterized protein n=1 Tax=Brevundimonas abyssalis TAR-001 TaxID=1391729 RepID=A0A8E0KKR5_9CAUL|nr:hypothetical protein MBEBAB_0880 [Brevundimonas abyssalis TAR-001]
MDSRVDGRFNVCFERGGARVDPRENRRAAFGYPRDGGRQAGSGEGLLVVRDAIL